MPQRQTTAGLLAVAVAVAWQCLALLPPFAHAQGTSAGSSSGGAVMPSCAAKLLAPCAGYLNAATSTAAPAAACCGPLRDAAAANETACLCAVLLDRVALRAFGVAPEQAMLLAKRCNVTTASTSACTAATGAGGRPYEQLEVTARVTNTSANNATLIYSAADESSTDCDLIFCGRHSHCISENKELMEYCYCCEPNPNPGKCYSTRSECKANCPFCKT